MPGLLTQNGNSDRRNNTDTEKLPTGTSATRRAAKAGGTENFEWIMQSLLWQCSGKYSALFLNIWQICSFCFNLQAVGHCNNCQANLCEICFEAHLRQRSTAKHTLITLDDMRKKQMELLKGQSVCVARTTLKCFIHPTQDLKLYCVSCDQIACHNCTILLHKGHKFESLVRANKRAIKEFKDAFERNQKFHEYVNDSISRLNGSLPKIDAKADALQVGWERFEPTFLDRQKAFLFV